MIPDRVRQQLAVAQGHLDGGRPERAESVLMRLLRDAPASAEVNDLLAAAAVHRGNSQRAVYYRERACQCAPDDPRLVCALTIRYAELHRLDDAERVLREFLARRPHETEVRVRLAEVHLDQRRYRDAIALADGVLKEHPAHSGMLRVRATALQRQGRADEALDSYRAALALTPDYPPLVETVAIALNYAWGAPEQEVRAAHAQYGRLLAAALEQRYGHEATDDPERRLRVGLLSPDFRQHSSGFFIEPILDSLDRSAFEVHCYSTHPQFDAFTDRMRGKAAAFNVARSSNQHLLAGKIHQDRVDILIEFCGLMSHHSLPAMALKPAPVQITAIGYPNTTGVRAVDYRLVDSLTDPPGAEQWCVEKLLRLDPSFLCYRPPEFLLECEPREAPRAGGVRFGCFNSAMKVNDRLLQMWAQLLRRVPESTLVVKASGLEDAELRDVFRDRAARAGIEPGRLEVLGWMAGKDTHLELYNTIDVALDSFPYHGTTTTVEALAMGVPVVSLVGAGHRSRVGLSLLTNLGHPEWCVNSPEAYVEVAAALAEDRAGRAELKRTLRPALLASPVCDAAAYGAGLGRLLRDAWRRRCAGP